ncbi:unnamed protein product [Phaeothamnion confervicola]
MGTAHKTQEVAMTRKECDFSAGYAFIQAQLRAAPIPVPRTKKRDLQDEVKACTKEDCSARLWAMYVRIVAASDAGDRAAANMLAQDDQEKKTFFYEQRHPEECSACGMERGETDGEYHFVFQLEM